jgi:MFS family permease
VTATTRTLLRTNRDFRRLLLASVVSLTGDWFSFVAVADLVTELTGRPGAAAFVYAATVLPVFVASPVAGVIADKLDRKRVMIVADLVRVPIALALCVAAWTSSVPLAIVAIVLLGIGASFYDPVASAATPNLVAPEELALAQSLMGSMLLVGAGLGGLVAELFGRTAAFSVDAASFAISALLVAGIRKPMQEARSARPAGQPGVREALAYVRRDPVVGRLVLAKGVGWANGIVGLLPAFARIKFAGTNIATGLFFAARGLGALIGPIVANRILGPTPGPRTIVIACAMGTLGYAGGYALFPVAPVFGVAIALVVFAHLGGGSQWSLSTYGLQVATPDRLRGRVMALDYGIATLAIGVSSIIAGLLADRFGIANTTWLLAIVATIYAVIWLAWSLPATSQRAGEHPLEPGEHLRRDPTGPA